LREGTDLKYGARHLKRGIERHIVYLLARLLATEQVCLGDVITIECDPSERGLEFYREAEEALAAFVRPSLHSLARQQSFGETYLFTWHI
jgi:hypothetical protein